VLLRMEKLPADEAREKRESEIPGEALSGSQHG